MNTTVAGGICSFSFSNWGKCFAFVERQKRMIIDGQEFTLAQLFFHRKLKRLVAVELKINHFKAGYKGQIELYLNWLHNALIEAHERLAERKSLETSIEDD